MKIFFIPLSITFLNPKTLGCLFRTKNSLTWSVKCEKYTSENRRDEFIRKLYMNGTVKGSTQYLLLRTDILQQSSGGPDFYELLKNSLTEF